MPDREPFFTGGGEVRGELDLPPALEPLLRRTGAYLPSQAVRDAVEVSLLLGLPLLLTGEPGTGKSTLARALAHERFGDRILEAQVKSDTGRSDLLYQVDELARFRDVQPGRLPKRLLDYVQFQPLGEGILRACDPGLPLRDRAGRRLTGSEPFLAEIFGQHHTGVPTVGDLLDDRHAMEATRWVVLIDEIDKAPRDTPNDLLEELDHMSFAIPELQLSIPRAESDARLRPVVVITSNSEKGLPDAFLRRCAFHHIKFPEREELRDIIESRLDGLRMADGRLGELLDLFTTLRERMQRRPGTAELLQWLHVADQEAAVRTGSREHCAAGLRRFVSVVAKVEGDGDRFEAALRDWASRSKPA